jgi:hypothetical protein
MATDLALKTAREVLRKAVCECGCLESEHHIVRRANGTLDCSGNCAVCACPKFRAVAFYVVRYRDRP